MNCLRFCTVALAFILTGCSLFETNEDHQPVDETKLDLVVQTQAAYLFHEPVTIRIQNRSAFAVRVDPCRFALQIQDQDQWVTIQNSDGCAKALESTSTIGEFITIPAGTSYVDTLYLNRHPTQTYRYRYQYFVEDTEADLLPLEKTRTPGFDLKAGT